ncbi:hypothetical protein ACIGN6_31530 [Streptomyces sp. NPDC053792]|uniref:hypothetical protein n=1 Tax=Streptomyces sp. NPDC053792 TaxID=3365716 RepID=UPI0037CDF2BD
MDDGVQIKSWHYFSWDHALSASLLSRKCADLEAVAATDDLPPGILTEHRAYATASVIASVCFLEATINEFFETAERNNLEVSGGRSNLPTKERQRIADVTKTVEKMRALDKFQLVLHILGQTPFDRGARPLSDAMLLVRLRNELVHYAPRLRPLENEGQQTADGQALVRSLIGQQFPSNPFFADTSNPFFPDKCLGHGCTSWAWRTALQLADEFFDKVGTRPVYEDARERLQP